MSMTKQQAEKFKKIKFYSSNKNDPDPWYDVGTEAILDFVYPNIIASKISECYGLFEGIKDGRRDEEGCGFEEFDCFFEGVNINDMSIEEFLKD